VPGGARGRGLAERGRPEPTDTFSIIEPPLEHRWHKVWRSHGDENPLVAYYRRTKDGRPYRFSDLVSHLIQAYNNALRYSRALRGGDEEVRSIARGRVERLREAEVLVLAASGSSDREIGDILGIGHRTVEKHLQRSYAKLRIEGRSQATSFVDDLEREHRLT
jgi:DNA-binding CsgD family transcriptional regulator